ncbi:MAG: redoxin domain-containing protein [Methylococcaceae bacterium]|nr:redoxin domain-containing protein [Methylococcaceae bacterium]
MKQLAHIGKPAPALQLSDWVQGKATQLDQLLGQVILIEVFQLNCPGCFLYGLPQAIDLHQRYANKGLTVIGLSTFFEDFELNTLGNLKLLIEENIVIGETKRTLQADNRLIDGRLAYHLPFAVAMDSVIKQAPQTTEDEVESFIKQHVPSFLTHNKYEQIQIKKQVLDYLNSRFFTAETFKQYQLQGTPSHIIIDKRGILKACEFGHFTDLEWIITSLLSE